MDKFKMFGAFAVGATLLSGVLGSAAVLDVDKGAVQAADLNNLKCDTDGVVIEGYGVELDDLTGHFLKVSGIDAACNGYWLAAQIQTTSGDFNIAAVITGGTMQIAFPAPVPLADIIGVHIVIG